MKASEDQAIHNETTHCLSIFKNSNQRSNISTWQSDFETMDRTLADFAQPVQELPEHWLSNESSQEPNQRLVRFCNGSGTDNGDLTR